MASLTPRCYFEFDAGDRSRGSSYQRDGRVRLGPVTGEGLTAHVRGASDYALEVWWYEAARGRLGVFCDCPRFADFGRCKHLWAVLLEMDSRGLAAQVPGKQELRLLELQDLSEPLGDDDSRPFSSLAPPRPPPRQHPPAALPPSPPPWRRHLSTLRQALAPREQHAAKPFGAGELEVWYVVDLAATRAHGHLVVGFFQRRRKQSGDWGKVKALSVDLALLRRLAPGEDRALLDLLRATPYSPWYGYGPTGGVDRTHAAVVLPVLYDHVLPRVAASGRLTWVPGDGTTPDLARVLRWDPGPPWRLRLVAERSPGGGELRLRGELYRGDLEARPLAEPLLLTAAGLVLFPTAVARLDVTTDFAWISLLRQSGELVVPAADEADALAELWALPALPPIVGAEDFELREVRHPLRPRLVLRRSASDRLPGLGAQVTFLYDTVEVRPTDPRPAPADPAQRRLLPRDLAAERQALDLVASLPFASARGAEGTDLALPEKHLQAVVDRLLAAGWQVEAEGAPVRSSGTLRFSVSTGIDWLDLSIEADFAGVSPSLQGLLAALARRDRFVDLGDGSRGMLPQEWLDRYGSLARLASAEDGGRLRFVSAQALLLDALLADAPQVDVDGAFRNLRQRLLGGERIVPADEPPGFRGALRAYQKEGLGWLRFLGEVGFGGCLADDMGLGKTVQVLALLQGRRAAEEAYGAAAPGEPRRPSLVVAPRSVVFNWLDEAARFAPALRTLDYSGGERPELRRRFAEHDLVIATYGVVRRDAAHLRAIPFEHVIFDEAQAVKNSTTQAHKACRLLQARHRLALSGTPVENHLGELWALLELLNPGLLGRLPAASGAARGELSDVELTAVAKAVRPFLLRRTKGQVLAELPPKTEQTLMCTLDGPQRRFYDELRRHYQQALSQRIAKVGLGRAKILVLEALLRLRQAACHPGLVFPERAGEPSAKLETLCAQLEELRQEGHKALVFSQFTKLLGLLRPRLEGAGICCEYLDGRTRDRKERVERFQRDEGCSVFLVSLKAGGLGLNLTAAGYVFLLDPWWNPAVEAQAIDRAHRIGQERRVFAYRLVARDTVEEKILELQKSKRALADAIIRADQGVLRSLTREDLELLLS